MQRFVVKIQNLVVKKQCEKLEFLTQDKGYCLFLVDLPCSRIKLLAQMFAADDNTANMYE